MRAHNAVDWRFLKGVYALSTALGLYILLRLYDGRKAAEAEASQGQQGSEVTEHKLTFVDVFIREASEAYDKDFSEYCELRALHQRK